MLNEIVNHIKSRLGTTHRRLELSDDEIVSVIQTETLNTFSVYNPFFLEYVINLDTDKVEGSDNTFNIPIEIEGFKVIGVEKVFNLSASMLSYGIASASYGILGTDLSSSISAFINAKLASGISSVMLPPETFQYIHPSILRVYNIFPQQKMMCIIKTTHRKDLSTIPYGFLETFKKLALADVCNDLLGMRMYFQNIGTTFGEINLNTDMLKEYADKRDDLIETLRKNMLKNSGVKKIYTA